MKGAQIMYFPLRFPPLLQLKRERKPTMRTTTFNRRRLVWQTVSAQPTVTIRELSSYFKVNRITIRSDLTYLERCGYVKRIKNRKALDILIPYGEVQYDKID